MSKRGRYKGARRRLRAAHQELLVHRVNWGEVPTTDAFLEGAQIVETFKDGVEAVHDVFATVYPEGGGRAISRSTELRSYVAARALVEAQLETKGYAV